MRRRKAGHWVFIIAASLAAPVLAAGKFNKPPPEWTYDDDYTGQEEWGAMSPAYAACGTGTEQSPINISHTEAAALPTLDFRYKPGPAEAEHTKHGLVIRLEDAGLLYVGKEPYSLERIEFHSPSEHTFSDVFYLLEIHLIHKSPSGKLLIVAVFADMKEPSVMMDKILSLDLVQPGAQATFTLDPSQLVPASRHHYAYTGSLTYPPCTEGIEWRVLKQPITMSKEQMQALSHILGRNSRLTQPVYLRKVQESQS